MIQNAREQIKFAKKESLLDSDYSHFNIEKSFLLILTEFYNKCETKHPKEMLENHIKYI